MNTRWLSRGFAGEEFVTANFRCRSPKNQYTETLSVRLVEAPGGFAICQQKCALLMSPA